MRSQSHVRRTYGCELCIARKTVVSHPWCSASHPESVARGLVLDQHGRGRLQRSVRVNTPERVTQRVPQRESREGSPQRVSEREPERECQRECVIESTICRVGTTPIGPSKHMRCVSLLVLEKSVKEWSAIGEGIAVWLCC